MNAKTEELASLYVLDKLSLDERKVFEERLETDTELVLLVRELETAMEDQIRSLPQHPAPSHLLTKIQDQLSKEMFTPSSKPVITLPWATFAGWGMVAALLLGVGITLLFTTRNPFTGAPNHQPVILIVGMNSDSTVLETVPSVLPVDEFENFVQLAQMAENYWENPEELPERVSKSPLANTRGMGYAVFDPRSKQGFIAIQNLPDRRPGKNYLLWLKDSKSNVLECAGVIPLQEKDQGLFSFELDDDSPISSARVAFFITEEDAAEPKLSQPKGALVLGSDHI